MTTQELPTISVFTVTPQNPKEREDTVVEGVKAALSFADEVICFHCRPTDGTLEELKAIGDDRVKIIDGGDWELDRFVVGRKKNAALQHCTMDWCLLMDADEVFECPDVLAFKQELKKEVNAFKLRYLHFFSSPWLIKTAKSGFYQWKPSLFRNHAGNFIGGKGIMSNTEMDKYARPLVGHSGKLSEEVFRIFHYGHCKTDTITWAKKVNQLEATYEDDGHGQCDPKKFGYGMDNTEKFTGKHPETMAERVSKWSRV